MQKYSVAMCTYNGEKYVREQLESILNQTNPPSFVAVGDDGSTDSTVDIVDDVLSKSGIPFKVVRHDHLGVASNFLNTMKLCPDGVIFTSDQDDVWIEYKAEKMLKVFDDEPNALMVFSDGYLVDVNLRSLNSSLWDGVGVTKKMIKEGDWFHYLLKTCRVTGAAMAIRKTLLDSVDHIPDSWLHDGWLSWCAAVKNGLYPCNDKLFYYRQHGSNVLGVQPLTSLQRVKRYFSRLDTLDFSREKMYNRFWEILNKEDFDLDNKQKEDILSCMAFWDSMRKLKDYHAFKQICIILSKSAGYNKYYTGPRGQFRDVIKAFKS